MKTTGFSPAPDAIVKEHGAACAVVYGKIWRYCQMNEGACRASVETISDDLGMSRNTIKAHLKTLIAAGYIVDTTPDNNGSPHVYTDTGQFVMRLTVEKSQPPQKLTTPSEIDHQPPQFLTPTPSKIEDKDSIKKEKEDTVTDVVFSRCAIAYESNFGALTPMLAEELKDALSDYGEAIVMHGLTQAVKANVRRWNYARAVMEKTKVSGFNGAPSKKEKSANPGRAQWR